MSHDEDRALLQAWRDGDRAAGDQLARKHYAAVRRFFEVKATAAAEDLTQRTFLACAQSIDRLARAASFRAFLFGIARNVLMQHLERGRTTEGAVDFDEVPGRATRVSMLVARRLEQQLVLRALAEISDELAYTIQLYYWDGLSVREIADATETTPTAVTTRLHRARQQLRDLTTRWANRPDVRNRLADDIEGVTRSIAALDPDERA